MRNSILTIILLTAVAVPAAFAADEVTPNRKFDNVGDFGSSEAKRQSSVPLIDERPIVRDFRQYPGRDCLRTVPNSSVEFAPTATQTMSAEWVGWHCKVDRAIAQKVRPVAENEFGKGAEETASVEYTITADHHIKDVQLVTKTKNLCFNRMLVDMIKAMDGKAVLKFPADAKESTIHKTTTVLLK
jgi:hypothetical protein